MRDNKGRFIKGSAQNEGLKRDKHGKFLPRSKYFRDERGRFASKEFPLHRDVAIGLKGEEAMLEEAIDEVEHI